MAGAHVGRAGVPGCDGLTVCGVLTAAGVEAGIGSGSVDGPGVWDAPGSTSVSNESKELSVSGSDFAVVGMTGGVLIAGGVGMVGGVLLFNAGS
ncbi:MAG TPA: hypothetical protein VGE99_06525 [Candidatus Dormibacteraeota bacterium]